MSDQREPTGRRRKSYLLRLLWGLVAVWLAAGIGPGFVYKDRLAASWNAPKLDTPVVVIESDDWGLDFQAPNFVPPSRQLDARQAAGVERLVRVLRAHRDCVQRKPIVSAFVVMRQADTAAIAKDPKFSYHARPIDEGMPETVAALQQAESEGLFFLTHHARDHRDTGVWARKVKEAVEAAKAEGKQFDPAVVATFLTDDPSDRDRVFGEYFDNVAGYLAPTDQEALNRKVAEGVSEFKRIFGRRPVSTVPPRYLWGPQAESAFRANGIRYLHGINREGGRLRNPTDVAARVFGQRLSEGLIGLTRNVEFECDPVTRKLPEIDEMLAAADEALANGQPVVVCTHTWNYCTGDAAAGEAMARKLDELLAALEKEYPDLRYLSSKELGRLAETGRLRVTGLSAPEIRTVGGLEHAWLSGRHIYRHRAKARLYVRGLGVLFVCALAVTVLHLIRRRRRGRSGDDTHAA